MNRGGMMGIAEADEIRDALLTCERIATESIAHMDRTSVRLKALETAVAALKAKIATLDEVIELLANTVLQDG